MSIRTECPNGHQLVAKDELAGRRIKCPKCKVLVTIPTPVEEVIELSEDAIIEEAPEGTVEHAFGSGDPLFDGPQPDVDPFGDNAFAGLPEMDSIPIAPIASAKPITTSAASSQSEPKTQTKTPAKSDEKPLSGKLIAASVASIASLLVGLLVLVVLLVTRDGNAPTDRQVAQVDTQQTISEPVIAEPSTKSRANDKEPAQTASTAPQSAVPQSASSQSASSAKSRIGGSKFSGSVLPIKASGSAIAFDSLTGDLAVATGAQEVLIYRQGYFAGETTAVSKPVKIDSDAPITALCFKPIGRKNLLLVSDGEKMWMYDAETLQLFNAGGKISNPITVGASGLFSSSNPNDHYVYTSQTQFAIAPLICEKHFPVTQRGDWINPESLVIGVSPSGRLLYRPGTAQLAYPTTFAGESHHRQIPRNEGNDVDPADQIVYADGKIRPIKQPQAAGIQVDAGRMICFLANTPWLVFINNDVLTLVHRDSGATHPLMPLPKSMVWKKAEDPKKSRHNTIEQELIRGFYDVHHDRLLLCRGTDVASIPLNSFIPEDRLLAVRVDIPTVLRPGQELSVAVAPSQPDIKISLADGPDGAQLTDGTLRWTPTSTQIGKQTLKLRFESGIHVKDQEIDLVVSELSVDLPFETQRSVISRDGTHILAWSYDPFSQDTFRFAYINAHTREVRISEQQTGTPSLACSDANSIYVFTSGLNLMVFDSKTLELKTSLYLAGFTSAIGMIVDDQFLRLQSKSRYLFLQLPDLKPLDAPAAIAGRQNWRRLADGRYAFGAAVFDESMKSIEFHWSIPGMLGLRGSGVASSYFWEPGRKVTGAVSKQFGIAAVHVQRKLIPLVLDNGDEKSNQPGNPMLKTTVNAIGIRPIDAPLILATRKPTTLRYEGFNGSPPYQFEAQIATGSRTPYKDFITPGREAGTFVIDGPKVSQAFLSDKQFWTEIRFPIQSLVNQARSTKENLIAKHYRSTLFKGWSAELQPKFTKFPIAIPISISVTDSKNLKTVMMHTLVMDLPADRVIALARMTLKVQPENAKPNKPIVRQPTKPTLDLKIVPSDKVNRQWFSNQIRQRHRDKQSADPKDPSNHSLKHQALLAVLVGHASTSNKPQREIQRTWNKLDGSQIVGTLKTLHRNELTIAEAQGRQHSVLLKDLDFASLEAAWHALHSVDEKDAAQDHLATVGQNRLGTVNRRGLGLADFLNLYRFQVPSSLDDGDGKPLLSWRVLVLPYFGYKDLYNLFNLDEPWDSPHNRQLLPYMPVEYSLIPHIENVGRTPFLAPIGPQTSFPHDGLVRSSEFHHPSRSRQTICVFTVKREWTVPWTKPEDLDVTAEEFPRDKLAVLRKFGRGKIYYTLSYSGKETEISVESTDPRYDLREGATLPQYRSGPF